MSGHDITLLRPLWLLALPLVALAGWWLLTRRGGLDDWQRAADPALLRAMAALGRIDGSGSRVPLFAVLAMVTVTVIALSGPAVERRDTLSFRNLDGVLFVLDVSDSVTGAARWPQLQTMGRFGLAALGTRPAGLIAYAGDAYVATDMTLDHLQLGQSFSLLGQGVVPDKGSRPERALALAADVMRDADVIAGDVVLLTDGAGLGPASLEAAAVLASQGVRLSLVVLDAPDPAVHSHAAIGQGRVFTLEDTDALARWLRDDARTRLRAQDYPLLYWRDLGRYLMVLALVPLLLLFRRQAA